MEHYKILSTVFLYPDAEMKKHSDSLRTYFLNRFPARYEYAAPFIEHLQSNPVSELEEYYISTFDIHAASVLDIGFVLFGEDLKRGEFLLKLKEEHEKAGNNCGNELPDYLPNILNLLALDHDKEFSNEFVSYLLIPVLRTLIKNFKSNDNVYKGLMEFLLNILVADFGDSHHADYKVLNSFDCKEKGAACGLKC